MNQNRFDPRVLKDPSWWHWATTVPLLAASLAGVSWALPAAVMLCGGAAVGYYAHVRSWRPYPVQIRLAFLAMLIAGALPYMAWLHVVQLAGTSAMVTIGYCALARCLMLAPWNRSGPLSRQATWQAFVVLPRAGGLLSPTNAAESFVGPACSLQYCSCGTRATNVKPTPDLATQSV